MGPSSRNTGWSSERQGRASRGPPRIGPFRAAQGNSSRGTPRTPRDCAPAHPACMRPSSCRAHDIALLLHAVLYREGFVDDPLLYDLHLAPRDAGLLRTVDVLRNAFAHLVPQPVSIEGGSKKLFRPVLIECPVAGLYKYIHSCPTKWHLRNSLFKLPFLQCVGGAGPAFLI